MTAEDTVHVETIRSACAVCLTVCGEGCGEELHPQQLLAMHELVWVDLDRVESATEYDLLCFECYRAALVVVHAERLYRLLQGQVTGLTLETCSVAVVHGQELHPKALRAPMALQEAASGLGLALQAPRGDFGPAPAGRCSKHLRRLDNGYCVDCSHF